jgi:hypothetical protein
MTMEKWFYLKNSQRLHDNESGSPVSKEPAVKLEHFPTKSVMNFWTRLQWIIQTGLTADR